jgi:flavin-dependent dehydrogenase
MEDDSGPRYDVVVVGARPAGAATAMLMARAGLQVLVVDKMRRGADTISTHALMRAGVLQLTRWGLLDRVIAAGTPPIRQATFYVGPDTTTIPVRTADGVHALYAPRRTVLDPIIAEAAEAAGATFYYGVTVKGLHRDPTGRVTGVNGHDHLGRPFSARARLTVGADGMSSRVAHWAGAATEHRGSAASAIYFGYWADLPAAGYEWYFRPGAGAGAIPTNDGQTCVYASTARDRLDTTLPAAAGFQRLLDRAAPELAEQLADAMPAGPLRYFAGRPGHLRRATGPGWALVGDAGYFKDPITPHGITDGLRDAELLSGPAVSALSSGPDEMAALADYQAIRDRLSLPLFTATEAIARYDWTPTQVTPLLRQASAAMAAEVAHLLAARADAVRAAGVVDADEQHGRLGALGH